VAAPQRAQPLPQPQAGEQDRDQRLRLLEQERLDEVAVAEGEREEDGSQARGADADGDDRGPLTTGETADLMSRQPEERGGADDEDHVLHEHQLGRLDQAIAREVVEKRHPEEGVGAPEHRSDGDHDHGEAIGGAAHEAI